MGSFPGHAIPGTFFTVFALWWATQLPRRKMMCHQKKIEYFNTLTFPVPFEKWSKYPVEGIVKMFASIIGMAAELWASTDYGKVLRITSLGDTQHFTMYSFFLMSGVIDCFVYRGSSSLPKGIDYLALTVAYLAEWVLFRHHLMGRSALDTQLHTALLYVIAACALCTLIEIICEQQEVVTLLRSYFNLLQGTWFYQVGFILYPPVRTLPFWDGEESTNLQLASIIFATHCICDLVVVGGIYLISMCCYKQYCRLFDFHVEHQLVARGWTLKKLRQKKKDGVVYTELSGVDNELFSLDENDEIDTEI